MFKKLFCKHEYVEKIEKIEQFYPLHGEPRIIICNKCGNVKERYFKYYD